MQGFITNWGKCYYKLGQLSYYKMRKLLQIKATVITNWNSYYKLGQLLQIGAIITNWGIILSFEKASDGDAFKDSL